MSFTRGGPGSALAPLGLQNTAQSCHSHFIHSKKLNKAECKGIYSSGRVEGRNILTRGFPAVASIIPPISFELNSPGWKLPRAGKEERGHRLRTPLSPSPRAGWVTERCQDRAPAAAAASRNPRWLSPAWLPNSPHKHARGFGFIDFSSKLGASRSKHRDNNRKR